MQKLIFLLFICANFSSFAQSSMPFLNGEQLEYKVHYGPLVAGTALLKVTEKENTYQFSAYGKSTGLFNFFFKVRDYYESISTDSCLCPLYFNRNVNEGNYSKNENVFFNYELNQAESTRDTITLTNNTQDILSMFYYLRTLNQDSIAIGQSIPLQVYLDDSFLSSEIIYSGKDTIKTKFGNIPSTKWIPQLEAGRVFNDEYGMCIWVSDDENKIPLRIETKVMVGSIKMDLLEFKGLKAPLQFIMEK
tara:strand:- start:1227 stop:1970 length:744 start_codon:yes stop_codon:yes gene_type:complete